MRSTLMLRFTRGNVDPDVITVTKEPARILRIRRPRCAFTVSSEIRHPVAERESVVAGLRLFKSGRTAHWRSVCPSQRPSPPQDDVNCFSRAHVFRAPIAQRSHVHIAEQALPGAEEHRRYCDVQLVDELGS